MQHILIIEDEPLVALDIKKHLQKQGFGVSIAAGESQAVQEMAGQSADIIISDINLGGVCGIEVIQKLQEKYDFVVVYLTSYDDDYTIDKALGTEPVTYLTKPFKPNDLYSAVKLAAQKCRQLDPRLPPNWRYEPANKALYYHDKPVKLTAQEARLFDICYKNRGYYVPLQVVDEYVWGDKSVTESTRRGLLYRLRQKTDPAMLECSTVHGFRLGAF